MMNRNTNSEEKGNKEDIMGSAFSKTKQPAEDKTNKPRTKSMKKSFIPREESMSDSPKKSSWLSNKYSSGQGSDEERMEGVERIQLEKKGGGIGMVKEDYEYEELHRSIPLDSMTAGLPGSPYKREREREKFNIQGPDLPPQFQLGADIHSQYIKPQFNPLTIENKPSSDPYCMRAEDDPTFGGRGHLHMSMEYKVNKSVKVPVLKESLQFGDVNNDITMIRNEEMDITRLKELIPRGPKNYEDPSFDIKGKNREWRNWVVKTFDPKEPISVEEKDMPVAAELEKNCAMSLEKEEADDQEIEDIDILCASEECKQNHTMYQDKKFPPEYSSIDGFHQAPSNLQDHSILDDIQELTWYRPAQIFKNHTYSVMKGAKPSGVVQGIIGDCYFIASIAALAKKPERLRKLLKVRTVSDIGLYVVSLCICGVFEEIVIDDFFPCKQNELAFARTLNYDIWGSLLEKAWAKVHGGYLNIADGLIDETLHDLTGAPTEYIFLHPDSDNAVDNTNWQKLKDAQISNYPMACGTKELDNVNKQGVHLKTGLLQTHAYVILDVMEVAKQGANSRIVDSRDMSPGPIEKIIVLHNPWGNCGEWKGKWSPKSPDWNSDFANFLKKYPLEPGSFFITFEELKKYFHCFVITRYHDNYDHTSVKISTSCEDPTILKFDIETPGHYYFTISQCNRRMFREEDKYVYSAVTMLLARKGSTGNIHYVASVTKVEKDMWVEANCQKGEYIVYILTSWCRRVNHLGFAIYGPSQIESIQSIPESDLSETFVMDCMVDKARKSKKSFKTFQSMDEPKISWYSYHNQQDFGYIFIHNGSEDTQVTANIEFEATPDVIFYPKLVNNNAELVVLPKRQKIVVYRMSGSDAYIKFSERFHFVKNLSSNCRHIKEKGLRVPYLYKGKDIGVSMYCYKLQNAIVYLFDNKSSNAKFMLKCKFRLDNCRLSASNSNLTFMSIRPGAFRYLVIKALNPSKDFSADILDEVCSFDDTLPIPPLPEQSNTGNR